MANDLDSNPWIIDTAAVIKDQAVEIERMEYIPSVTTNVIQIEDQNGRVVWKRTAVFTEGAGEQVWNQPYTFNGFEVAVITAGTLYVWLKNMPV